MTLDPVSALIGLGAGFCLSYLIIIFTLIIDKSRNKKEEE